MHRKFLNLLVLSLIYTISAHGLLADAYAQEDEQIIVISEKVGRAIDLAERNRYSLFPEIEGFRSAMFFQLPDSTILVKIDYVETGKKETKLLKNLSGSEIEKVREHIESFDELHSENYEGEKKPKTMPRQMYKNQPIALAVILGIYAPSLNEVNKLIADVEEHQFPDGPYVGIRAVLSVIPEILLFGEYSYWESIVEGWTELYIVDLRLKVQSVHLTGLYQIYGDLFAVGGGFGIYFADYKDTQSDEVHHHLKNQAVGFHLCAGIIDWPDSKLFNLSLEVRYVFATIGGTSEGFPKTELSGPMIAASIMF
jgi:hypothetical protein